MRRKLTGVFRLALRGNNFPLLHGRDLRGYEGMDFRDVDFLLNAFMSDAYKVLRDQVNPRRLGLIWQADCSIEHAG